MRRFRPIYVLTLVIIIALLAGFSIYADVPDDGNSASGRDSSPAVPGEWDASDGGERAGHQDGRDDLYDENPRDPGEEDTMLPALEDTVTICPEGEKVVTNPDDILVLVNKERNLPADYVPSDLVEPDIPFPFEGDHPKKLMRVEAAEALEQLVAGAWDEGLEIYGLSGYRSYATQAIIFQNNVERRGEEEANKFSARPGQSEHQTGLAMDVTSASVNFRLVQSFGDTPEGRWISEHAAEYGFIVRYPRGSEDITGYQYEPWHLRYVGVEHARAIVEADVTLEEYLGQSFD